MSKASKANIFISGTSSGIGKAIAYTFLKRGHVICGCSRSSASIFHENYIHYECDLTVEADVDLMIVDTEGYELNVLKGAVETIKKFLPVIVMEIHKNKDLTSRYGYNKFENAKFLTNLGYVAKGYINDEDVIFIKK